MTGHELDPDGARAGTGKQSSSGGPGPPQVSRACDVAEYFPKADPGASFESGQVVGLKDGAAVGDPTAGDTALVVTTNPMLTGNLPDPEEETEYVPLALLGQIPVAVDKQVDPGDLLVATSSGVARPMDGEPGNALVVGRALERADPDTRRVWTFVGGPTGAGREQIAALNKRMDETKQSVVQHLKQTGETLEQRLRETQDSIADQLEATGQEFQDRLRQREIDIEQRLQERLAALEERVQEREANIEQLKGESAAKEERVTELETAVENRDQHIESLAQAVETREDRIDALEREVDAKEDRVDELEQTVAQRDRLLDELESEATSLRKENDALRDWVAELEERVSSLEADNPSTAVADD